MIPAFNRMMAVLGDMAASLQPSKLDNSHNCV